MAKRQQKAKRSGIDVGELAIVVVVEDMEDARNCESLLKANEIPATIKAQQNRDGGGENFAIMVPEDYIDEAHVVVESQDTYDDFYDLAFDDEDEESFDSSLLDEEF